MSGPIPCRLAQSLPESSRAHAASVSQWDYLRYLSASRFRSPSLRDGRQSRQNGTGDCGYTLPCLQIVGAPSPGTADSEQSGWSMGLVMELWCSFACSRAGRREMDACLQFAGCNLCFGMFS